MKADDLRAVAAEIREGHQRWGDSDELAKWNPAVTGAVADWLDSEANHMWGPLEQAIAFVNAWRGES